MKNSVTPFFQWIPSKWRIAGTVDRTDEVCIVAVPRSGKPDRYAIRRHEEVMNRRGDWEHEQRPSERDADFLARTRFNTFEEACALYANHARGADLPFQMSTPPL